MKRENFKYADPFTLNSIIAAVAIIIILKGNLKIGIFLLILFIVVLVLLKKYSPGVLIENKFQGPITAKLENGCVSITQITTPLNVDGIKTHTHKPTVYKVVGGTNVYVNKNGIVKAYNPISQLSIKKLTNPPDKCWDELFINS